LTDDALCAGAVAVTEVEEDLIKSLGPAAVAAEQPVLDSHNIDFSLTAKMTRHDAPLKP
jgi:hypothetical protein